MHSNPLVPHSVEVKVPGKLYLAGEYATLFTKQPALILAINQFLMVKLSAQPENTSSFLSTDQAEMADLEVDLLALEDIDVFDPQWHLVLSALKTGHQYIESLGKDRRNYRLEIKSDLNEKDGKKYGLGSSGAVTVATLKALLQLHQIEFQPLQLYKLAVLTMKAINNVGSFGDLAASCHRGAIHYQAPDQNWLDQMLAQVTEGSLSLKALIDQDWPLLEIRELNFPSDWYLLIGWTQSPASTNNRIADLLNKAQASPKALEDFLKQSPACVADLEKGIQNADWQLAQTSMGRYRQLLNDLSTAYKLNIEITLLSRLVTVAQRLGYQAKSSGAGGGDCGIAIGIEADKIKLIHQAWEASGIQPLEFGLYQ